MNKYINVFGPELAVQIKNKTCQTLYAIYVSKSISKPL